MKLVDRYLIKAFLAPFGVCVLIFCVLVTLGRFFDKMGTFVRFHASFQDVIRFLLLGLPFWLNLVLPVATMLALLFSLGQLQQRGEFTAFRGAGIPSWRLYLPLLLTGLLLAFVSLASGLTFLPKLNFESRKIYRVDIKKRSVLAYQQDNLVAAGQNRRRFTIGWLDADAGLMKDVVVDRFDDNYAWVETYSAKIATYQNGRWRFENGIWRSRDAALNLGVKEESFEKRWVDIPEKPSDFAVEDKDVDDMTGSELVERAARLSRRGAPYFKEQVTLHLRLALPFANVIVMLIAIPYALKSGVRARTQNFSYALVIAFLYWGGVSVFESMGEQGRMPPWMAAWMANGVFGAFAAWKLGRFT